MKTLAILCFVSGVFCSTLTGRDLHLIDGRVFRDVQSPKVLGDQLRFIHSAGVVSISGNTLSRADYYEYGLHLISQNTAPQVLAVSSNASGNTLASSETSSGYSDRSYASRNYSNRSYSPLGLASSTAIPTPTAPNPTTNSYTSPSRYSKTPTSSGGGTVNVSGHYRNGKWVNAYTRRK